MNVWMNGGGLWWSNDWRRIVVEQRMVGVEQQMNHRETNEELSTK